MNYNEALDKLFSLHQFGIKLGLDNIKNLLNEIGNPQNSLKCFHVAGSNGKGSTASYIASMLMELGYKVGLYTSPHILSFNERIRINGKKIEDDYIVDFVNKLNPYIDKNSPTFFELTTALAFQYFNEAKVDYAVIETGLGGRLDATNVINPVASVITSISQEHTNVLGFDLRVIASEKGAIIKSNGRAYVGSVPEETKSVFSALAEDSNATISFIDDFIELSKRSCTLKKDNYQLNIYNTILKGKHQFYNSSLAALAVCDSLNLELNNEIIQGIENVQKNSGFFGRYQIINKNPKIIIDAAHNPESLSTFIDIFKDEWTQYSSRTLFFGAMNDKDIAKMLKMITPYFDEIYALTINYERAEKKEKIVKIGFENNINISLLENEENYIKEYIAGDKDKCLVILGSIYILGNLLNSINEKKILTLE